MKILKRKLQGEALRKLLVHLHAHSHISDILKFVRKVENEFESGICPDLKLLGSSLNDSIQEFFDEYVPHMKEEEQVFVLFFYLCIYVVESISHNVVILENFQSYHNRLFLKG